jgi:hypothetical protein
MIGNFKTTSDADIAALLEKPKRIEKIPLRTGIFNRARKKDFLRFLQRQGIERNRLLDAERQWRRNGYRQGLARYPFLTVREILRISKTHWDSSFPVES